jgi:large subunit ribosomal protein L21
MSYAIFESGGKQYKAVPGDTIEVDRLKVEEGAQIEIDQVLLLSDGDEVHVGAPTVDGATVKATVQEHTKGRKILVFKYIPRERYRRKRGHRQHYTRLHIDEISLD